MLEFNTSIQSPPGNMIARPGFVKRDFFEAEPEAAVPAVLLAPLTVRPASAGPPRARSG